MIECYTWKTSNGRKATIMLEECGLDYNLHPINIGASRRLRRLAARWAQRWRLVAGQRQGIRVRRGARIQGARREDARKRTFMYVGGRPIKRNAGDGCLCGPLPIMDPGAPCSGRQQLDDGVRGGLLVGAVEGATVVAAALGLAPGADATAMIVGVAYLDQHLDGALFLRRSTAQRHN